MFCKLPNLVSVLFIFIHQTKPQSALYPATCCCNVGCVCVCNGLKLQSGSICNNNNQITVSKYAS